MSRMVRLAVSLYACLARWYPREFRREFGEEMRAVFEDAASEAAKRSATALVGLCVREICSWPMSLGREYWAGVRTCVGRKAISRLANDQHWNMDSRRQALISALPPLLLGLAIVSTSLIVWGPWLGAPSWRLIAGVVVGLIPVVVLAIGGLVAIAKRLPDWGYTWSGAGLMGFTLLVKTLAEEQADSGASLISPAAEMALGAFLLLAICALLGVAALRGWRQAGLVSIGFSTMTSLSLYSAVTVPPFNRHDLALLAAPVALLIAGLTYVYCRGHRGDVGRAAVLVSFGLLNVCTLWVANAAWESWLLANGRPSPVLPLFVVLTGMLMAGPVLGALWLPIRRTIKGA